MRILVIEDNPDIAANLGDYLEDQGHTVDFAADGVTGLHLAVVHDFDAIVLDLNLPGMDGLEAIGRIRARTDAKAELPIIVVTADAAVDLKERCLQQGADEVLFKPVAMDQLFDAIGRIMARRAGDDTVIG